MTDNLPAKRGTLLERLGAKYLPDTPKAEVLAILNATAFKTKDGPPSNAQVAALLVVANQYGLNPWTREIFAFPDKQNGIVPVVGIDGWNRIANDHPQYAGETLEIAPRDEWEKIDEDAKLAPPWMKVTVYRKDRDHGYEHVEYLDECYRPPFVGKKGQSGEYKIAGPWQSHTKRMLEHKARIQARRGAFGFAGIYDEDEAERISGDVIEGTATEVETVVPAHLATIVDLAADRGLEIVDLQANAEALGHVGPLEEMPVDTARKLEDALAKLPSVGSAEPAGEELEAEVVDDEDDPGAYWPDDEQPPVDEPEPEGPATKAARAAQERAAEKLAEKFAANNQPPAQGSFT